MASKMDDDLFEDVPFNQESASVDPKDDDLFEDVPYSESSPSIGQARAALVGAGQGATFGFGEELTAPFVAAAGMAGGLPDESPDESTLNKFKRLMHTYRDVAREEQQVAQEEQPWAYLAGNVAGGFLTPVPGAIAKTATKNAPMLKKMTTGAVIGAGYGTATGLGEAQGGIEERLPEGIISGGIGAVGGAALPLAGSALSDAGNVVKSIGNIPIVDKAGKAFKAGLKGINLVSKKGTETANKLVRKNTAKFLKELRALRTNVGTKIDDAIQTAKNEGSTVDLKDEVGSTLSQLDDIISKHQGIDEVKEARNLKSEIYYILNMDTPEILAKKAQDAEKLRQIAIEKARQSRIGKEVDEAIGNIKTQLTDDGIPSSSVMSQPPVSHSDITVPPVTIPKPDLTKVDPERAMKLKRLVDRKFTPKSGQDKPIYDANIIAKEFKHKVSDQIDEVTGLSTPGKRDIPSLNAQYGKVADSLKRLLVSEKKLPTQTVEKVNKLVRKLQEPGKISADAREALDDVYRNLKSFAPELEKKYKPIFNESVSQLQIADEIEKGFARISLGLIPTGIKASANIAGRAAKKLGGEHIAKAGSAVSDVAGSLADKASKSSTAGKVGGFTQYGLKREETQEGLKSYVPQKRIASYIEKTDPDTLINESNRIRDTYGKKGEQLAMILQNMASKDKNARRALMFTILQNQGYMDMLGPENE